MTQQSSLAPPRLLPEQPFPPYAYVPGLTPHPTRDPRGHSYRRELNTLEPPDPEEWQSCRSYLYGIDLFNHRYCWEAHEAWEGLWVACGRAGPTAAFLQALVNLAAVGFKARLGNARGMTANAQTAVYYFKSVASHCGSHRSRYMGLDFRALADYAVTISKSNHITETANGEKKSLAFDLVLKPD